MDLYLAGYLTYQAPTLPGPSLPAHELIRMEPSFYPCIEFDL